MVSICTREPGTDGPATSTTPFRTISGAFAVAFIAATTRQPACADVSDQLQARYVAATTKVVEGRYAAARADAVAMLRLRARDPRATAVLIDADFLDGRTWEATASYASCAACMPHSPVDAITRDAVLHGRGALFFRRLMSQLSEPYPDGRQPVHAVIEAARGRYAEALRSMTAMVTAQPTRPDLRFYRALLFTALRRHDEARRDFGIAALFRPSLPDAGMPLPLDRMQQVSLWALSALSHR
jgi:predicted Zn-dependent protease